jgi:C4-type Zn-finger protein
MWISELVFGWKPVQFSFAIYFNSLCPDCELYMTVAFDYRKETPYFDELKEKVILDCDGCGFWIKDPERPNYKRFYLGG